MTISTRLAELPPMPTLPITYPCDKSPYKENVQIAWRESESAALRARLSLVLEVLEATIDPDEDTRESDDARLVLEVMKEFR